MNQLKNHIKKFEKMLKNYPDETKYSYEFLYFFKSLVRINDSNTIPTIELGTILKHEKPHIFQDLKSLAKYNQVIDVITQIDMNYQDAVKRINEIK